MNDSLPAAALAGVPAYDFLVPGRIVFGWGRRQELGRWAATLGRRAFLVVGSQTLTQSGQLAEIRDNLAQQGVRSTVLAEISREPLVADVDAAVANVRAAKPTADDLVIAIGGGSAIDLGKAVAALALNSAGDSVADYLEGVGRGLSLSAPLLPVIAVPTTAGTGSEATKNSVISSLQPVYKKSLRADSMLPRIALIDPELTVSVPPAITAATGLDAITQLIESYISCRAKPMAQALCLSGLRQAVPALRVAVRDGANRPAREALSYAALLSGIALANSGLGLAHGVAAALGVTANVPHGLACAVMLPVALRLNRTACAAQYTALAQAITADPRQADADTLISVIESLLDELQIPRRLSAFGITAAQIPELVRGSRGNSMSGNPREVLDAELTAALESLL